jgi:uncharacterized membrane protein
LAGLLSAPAFDRAAVEGALTGAREADIAVRTRAEAAVVDYAAGLSPADRAVFVQGLARGPTLRRPPPRRNPPDAATDNPAPAR